MLTFLRSYTTKKLEPYSVECVFMGYASKQKRCICLDRESTKFYISRYVIFNKTIFPFASTKDCDSAESTFSNDFICLHVPSWLSFSSLLNHMSTSPAITRPTISISLYDTNLADGSLHVNSLSVTFSNYTCWSHSSNASTNVNTLSP